MLRPRRLFRQPTAIHQSSSSNNNLSQQQRDSRRQNRFPGPNRSVETPAYDGFEFQLLCRLFGPANQRAVASPPPSTQQPISKRQCYTSPAERTEAAQKRAGFSPSSDGHFRFSGADSVPSAATASATGTPPAIGAQAISVHHFVLDPVRQPLLPPSQLLGQQTSFQLAIRQRVRRGGRAARPGNYIGRQGVG